MTLARFGLYPFRSPLLRVSRLLSFPQGTEMFQFPWFPPTALCVQAAVTLHDECWVSPFGHLRIEAQSTAPRSFSQSLTSFIGSWRQGIHRWLFVAWKEQDCLVTNGPKAALKDARACSAVLKERCPHATRPGRSAGRSRVTPSKRKRRRVPSQCLPERGTESLSTSSGHSDSPPVHQLGVSRAGWTSVQRRQRGTP